MTKRTIIAFLFSIVPIFQANANGNGHPPGHFELRFPIPHQFVKETIKRPVYGGVEGIGLRVECCREV